MIYNAGSTTPYYNCTRVRARFRVCACVHTLYIIVPKSQLYVI